MLKYGYKYKDIASDCTKRIYQYLHEYKPSKMNWKKANYIWKLLSAMIKTYEKHKGRGELVDDWFFMAERTWIDLLEINITFSMGIKKNYDKTPIYENIKLMEQFGFFETKMGTVDNQKRKRRYYRFNHDVISKLDFTPYDIDEYLI